MASGPVSNLDKAFRESSDVITEVPQLEKQQMALDSAKTAVSGLGKVLQDAVEPDPTLSIDLGSTLQRITDGQCFVTSSASRPSKDRCTRILSSQNGRQGQFSSPRMWGEASSSG